MKDPSEIKLKYGVVAIIWLGVFVLIGLMVTSGAMATGDGWGAGFMGAAAFLGAALGTGILFNWGQLDPADAARRSEAAKSKNDQRLDPISLLTEEDLAELREEIKYDLRRRLLQREEGELDALDALIAGQEAQKRR